MKKKILLIVLPIILVIAIAITVVVVLLSKKEDESIGTKWGDTYYAYLKEAVNEDDLTSAEEKYGIMLGMKNAKIQFCEVDEGQDPTMIMTYEKENSSYVNVYQITDKKKVNYIAYKQPTEVEYLYNIENDEYSWYIHVTGTDSDSYSSLKNISERLKTNAQESTGTKDAYVSEMVADYTILKDEATITQETTDGSTITLDKFDEIFVRPEIEPNEQIDFNVDMTDKELKKSLKDAVDDYKKDTKKITDEVKEKVAKKVEETKEIKTEMETAKKDIEKKKEEARTLTNANVQEKIGENLKWFSAAYLGEVYGWMNIYTYKPVKDSISLPGVTPDMVVEIFELEGAKSKTNMKAELSKYVDSSKFGKFTNYSEDLLQGLTEYNGNVYWVNAGVGDGPEIDTTKANVVSSKDGVSKVTLKEYNMIVDMSSTITLTVEYKDGKFLITDWDRSN